jgi:hypothetical protein
MGFGHPKPVISELKLTRPMHERCPVYLLLRAVPKKTDSTRLPATEGGIGGVTIILIPQSRACALSPGLADLVRQKEVSPEALLDAAIARVEARNQATIHD